MLRLTTLVYHSIKVSETQLRLVRLLCNMKGLLQQTEDKVQQGLVEQLGVDEDLFNKTLFQHLHLLHL